MFGEVIMSYEGFPTFVTLVALVVMVNSQVEPAQGTDSSAFKGLHTVNNIRYLQIPLDSPIGAAMTETLPTDTTEVGLLPTVDPHVLPQGRPARGQMTFNVYICFWKSGDSHVIMSRTPKLTQVRLWTPSDEMFAFRHLIIK